MTSLVNNNKKKLFSADICILQIEKRGRIICLYTETETFRSLFIHTGKAMYNFIGFFFVSHFFQQQWN